MTAQRPSMDDGGSRGSWRVINLRATLIERLEDRRSLKQIAGRLKLELSSVHRLCHETIHPFVTGAENRSQEPARYLLELRSQHRSCFAKKPRRSTLG
ncbi:hypothetical protein [Rubellimicrobium roseum]|uniref:Helix-turn-helix domain-containing protein n=1 Tax=Rubellimicrobium roseum TaxID=687525 RepID=A0A5C4N8U1_9RHOB|nr:hypothetical protein [Rubellimicrobium roseum]TNC61817.1 hypothetical protein FHG71_20920 [Rubellimicrobium roseum]